ncbi:MAG: hypothetical protein DDT26_00810 [Dehalococcoidia bacterium]|nr:hypothetical protein [Chloroflexota bacterium]
MADVRPFRGIRYNARMIGDLSSVITPPYDVITPEQQSSYHRRNPHNIIRLEFGQEFSDDIPDYSVGRASCPSSANKYTRAANTLNDWLRDGVLVRDQHPAFYLTEHRVPYLDSHRSYWGLIAAVRLEKLGAGRIRPTEITMKKPSIDRLNLIRACRANLSPIMGIFNQSGVSGQGLGVSPHPVPPTTDNRTPATDLRGGLQPLLASLDDPTLTAVDDFGVTFNVWVVTEAEMVRRIAEFLADRVIYIADGHHRYEMALVYRDEQLAAHPGSSGNEPFNFVMMTLIDSQDPGLALLPVHRLVKGIESERMAKLEEKLADYFHIEEVPYSKEAGSLESGVWSLESGVWGLESRVRGGKERDSRLSTLDSRLSTWAKALKEAGDRGMAFGLYGLSGCSAGARPRQDKFYLLTPKTYLHKMLPGDKPPAWKDLDVSFLHWVILRGMLGIDSPEKEMEYLEYSADGREVLRKVDTGMSQLAFFLNPVPISSLFAVADAGVRMPPKSTYFYPKTPAGLVTNPLWEFDKG